MGDRANVAVHTSYSRKLHEPGGCVVFYTHWRGRAVPGAVAAALKTGRDRWDDPAYLARVVFDWVKGGEEGTTGFGIDTDIGDNEYPLLVVDPATKKVLMFSRTETEEDRVLNTPFEPVAVQEWTFDEFVKLDEKEGFGWDAINPE